MIRSTPEFDQRIADWLEADPSDAPAEVLSTVVAALPSIQQARRGLLAPWRFPQMTNFMRAAAGVAIVAIVGVGIVAFISRSPGTGSNGSPPPTPTAAPTPAPTLTAGPIASPAPSELFPGITGWTTYTSEIYGFDFEYPDDWTVDSSATRAWRAGDTFEGSAYKESLNSPDEGGVQLVVWRMPVAAKADVGTLEGLKAWAKAACNEVAICDDLALDRALPMCLGQLACGPALLVPNENFQVAFIAHPSLERVTVVLVGRPDTDPTVVGYGGSVQLLKSILTQMDVWTPEPGQTPG